MSLSEPPKRPPKGPKRPGGGQDGPAPAQGPAAVPPALSFKHWIAEQPPQTFGRDNLPAALHWLVDALSDYLAQAFTQSYDDHIAGVARLAEHGDRVAAHLAELAKTQAAANAEIIALLRRIASNSPLPPGTGQH